MDANFRNILCDEYIILGRGGVLGQGKVSGSWVKKRFMGTLAVTGYGSG